MKGLLFGVCFKALVLSGFCCSSLVANSGDDYWDGKEYHQNSSSQKDAAKDLLKYIPIRGDERVLDVGCGDGKITAALAEELSQGSILGVDISPSMIAFARAEYKADNLDFALLSAEEVDFDKEFDIVLSFTAFQWVQDHQKVVQNIKKSLKPKGIYGVTMPMGLPKPLKIAVDETIAKDKWRSYFTDFHTGWNFVKKSDYETLLKAEGFQVNICQVVRQEDIVPSLKAFKGFISQWFPYLRPLPQELKEEFMDEVLSRYTELEPLDTEGRLHFKIERLEAVAEKR